MKITEKDLESKYTIVKGYAGKFYTSITGDLCLSYGVDKWNNNNPYTATFNEDGTVTTDNGEKLGKVYDFKPITESLYRSILAVNAAGFKIQK